MINGRPSYPRGRREVVRSKNTYSVCNKTEYLDEQVIMKDKFTISFSKEKMVEYLCVCLLTIFILLILILAVYLVFIYIWIPFVLPFIDSMAHDIHKRVIKKSAKFAESNGTDIYKQTIISHYIILCLLSGIFAVWVGGLYRWTINSNLKAIRKLLEKQQADSELSIAWDMVKSASEEEEEEEEEE